MLNQVLYITLFHGSQILIKVLLMDLMQPRKSWIPKTNIALSSTIGHGFQYKIATLMHNKNEKCILKRIPHECIMHGDIVMFEVYNEIQEALF
jgi:hypothetical protein